MIGASTLAALAVQALCVIVPLGWLLLALAMSTLIAARGLYEHVAAVAAGLEQGLEEGRNAVAHIVGRDPASLDAHGVARAAIELTAENFADGVVAPLFWGVLLGLPGMAAYKAINTLDSMIGHRSPRYLHFGRFAARLDDLANWLPARLAAVLILAASLCLPGASPRGRLAGAVARCAAASLAECRLARGGDRRQPRPQARRPPSLRRRDGRRRLDGRRPRRRHPTRHSPGAAPFVLACGFAAALLALQFLLTV